MIHHVSIGVSDIAKARQFYDAALAPLGAKCLSEDASALGYGGSDGPDCGSSGCGVVYELSASIGGGWSETVLETFNYADGGHPFGSLNFDTAGNIYGTTTAGGTFVFGTVFEIAH